MRRANQDVPANIGLHQRLSILNGVSELSEVFFNNVEPPGVELTPWSFPSFHPGVKREDGSHIVHKEGKVWLILLGTLLMVLGLINFIEFFKYAKICSFKSGLKLI